MLRPSLFPMLMAISWSYSAYGTLRLIMTHASSQQAAEHDIAQGGYRMLCGTCSGQSDGSPQTASDARGPGATAKLKAGVFLPQSYNGPTVIAASGAIIPRTALLGPYPVHGVAYGLPLHAAASTTYNATRPYKHTYPDGYTLLFISVHSLAYTGFYWAVYNQDQMLYGFDDDDITSGDYDYDDSDELPAGCKYADAQVADMNGVLNLMSAPGQAGAPAGGAASCAGHASLEVPNHAILAASQQGARLQGTSSLCDSSQAQLQILCRPVPARRAGSRQSTAAPQQSSGCGDFHFDTASLVDLVITVAALGTSLGLAIANLMYVNRRYLISCCPEWLFW